jgi:hypothetical protein
VRSGFNYPARPLGQHLRSASAVGCALAAPCSKRDPPLK